MEDEKLTHFIYVYLSQFILCISLSESGNGSEYALGVGGFQTIRVTASVESKTMKLPILWLLCLVWM
jgi:hypothetical protein